MPSRSPQRLLQRLRPTAARLAIGLATVVALLGVAAYGLLFVWPPTSTVETGATPDWPEIQPTAWRFSQLRTAAAVQESLATWQNWEACAFPTCTAGPSGTRAADATVIAGTVRGPFSALDLWLSIRIEANGEGGALIFARTETQNGRADFGHGARTLHALWQDVAANLGGDVTFVGQR